MPETTERGDGRMTADPATRLAALEAELAAEKKAHAETRARLAQYREAAAAREHADFLADLRKRHGVKVTVAAESKLVVQAEETP